MGGLELILGHRTSGHITFFLEDNDYSLLYSTNCDVATSQYVDR